MNLYDMYQRKDKNLIVDLENVSPIKVRAFGQTWRGLELTPSKKPQLILRNATAWHPLRQRPDFCGWYVWTLNPGGLLKRNLQKSTLSVELSSHSHSYPSAKLTIDSQYNNLLPVYLPWELEQKLTSPIGANLTFHLPQNSPEKVFLAIHKVITRDALIKQATGVGIEIGPGHNPQILPTEFTDVKYLEQKSAEDWQKLYNNNDKYGIIDKQWDRYIIGEAHDLPVDDSSLDFIFSSHVFEHLANPIGHLEYWKTKLKHKGKILAILPEVSGCKDYPAKPTAFNELISQYQAKTYAPSINHYVEYCRIRGFSKSPESLFSEKSSIHVNYFNNQNISELLEFACRELDFESFQIQHTANHKDFYFSLFNK